MGRYRLAIAVIIASPRRLGGAVLISLVIAVGSAFWPIEAVRADDPCGNAIDVGVLASSDTAAADESEHYLDFQRAIFDELAKRTGCRFNLQSEMPRSRQWKLFLAGHLPIIAAALPTPERDAVGWYEKLLISRNVLILRVDKPRAQDVTATMQNPDLRIGIVRGYFFGAYWEGLLADPASTIRRETFVDMQTVFHMMDIGRIDAAITNMPVYADLLPASHLSGRVALIDPPNNSPIFSGIYLSKKTLTPKIAQLLGRAIEAMRDDRSLEHMYARSTQAGTGDLFDYAASPVDFTK